MKNNFFKGDEKKFSFFFRQRSSDLINFLSFKQTKIKKYKTYRKKSKG